MSCASTGVAEMTAAGPSGIRPTTGLWTIVLAAGAARRFGRRKLLSRNAGTTLLAATVRQAVRTTQHRCVVVLGASASRMRVELRGLDVTVIINKRWSDGMASSLKAGVLALPPSARAALVLLADQYAVGASDLRSLASAWARRPLQPAAALVDNRLGAPAVLPRRLFSRIRMLQGDHGARHLLREAGMNVTAVTLAGAGLDLDRRRDLAMLRGGRWTARHPRRNVIGP
jgi:molybdenum cofactor cytidylyltransferase